MFRGRLDVASRFWGIVHHTCLNTYDLVTNTDEFKWFSDIIGTGVGFFMSEASFLPWFVVRDALDAAGMGLPAGVAWNMQEHTYEFEDVDALFAGLGHICMAVATNIDLSASTKARTRAEAVVACVRRMRDAVDVNELSGDLMRCL